MGTLGVALGYLRSTQLALSRRFDQLLPARFRVDGNHDFVHVLAPGRLRPALHIVDIGGGKSPMISAATKAALGLHIVGLDIDANELSQAPPGIYDRTIVADICQYRGAEDADLVICQALLEHVADVEQALKGIASILRPGGSALIWVPSRNAVYARLNLILPHKLKRRLLFAVYPSTRGKQGFRAFYDRCTPKDFRSITRRLGLETAEERLYFSSSYFTFFFPAHLLWRTWVVALERLAGPQAAESFSLVLTKPV